jgi:hypothetical protein
MDEAATHHHLGIGVVRAFRGLGEGCSSDLENYHEGFHVEVDVVALVGRGVLGLAETA